jgi:hypothetical protein
MRRLLVAVVLAAAILAAPPVAPSAALASAPIEAPAPSYLDQLLVEINVRRAQVGSPPLAYASADANLAVTRYLADLTPLMQARRLCFHGSNDPIAPGWDYVAAAGLKAKVGGEVLGCPGDDFYWTPKRIADGWWNSPSHFDSIYADVRANTVACGAYKDGYGGRGYATVACVTYKV